MAGQVRHLKVKGGRFYARVAVPKSVQAILGRTELVTAIGGERRDAMRALPGAVAVLQGQIALAQRQVETPEVEALVRNVTLSTAAKEHFRQELEADDRERSAAINIDAMRLSRSAYANRLRLAVAGAVELEELEALIGYAADDLDRKGLAPKVPRAELLRSLAEVHLDALAVAESRDEQRIRAPEPKSPLLTEPEPSNQDTKPVPLKTLFRDYLASRRALGKHRDGARKWETAVDDLARFAGHGDALQITKRNLLDWRDHLLKSGKAPKTVSDSYLAAIRAILRWAFDNDRLPSNEAENVRQEVPKTQRTRERGYTDTEAEVVLNASLNYRSPVAANAANRESGPIAAAKRWLPILGAFTGARPTELAQLRKQDIRNEDGRWIIRISPDAGTVKAGGYRDVPLHPQLVDLGFASFVHGAKDGPLFHNATEPTGYVKAARATSGRVSQWLQEQGLVPKDVQPSHGWRHRFKTVARDQGADPRIVDAIQGHAPRTAGDGYGDVTVTAKARVIDSLPRYRLATLRSAE